MTATTTPKKATDPANIFTREVTVPKLNPKTGAVVLDPAGTPEVGKHLGRFSFKIPTIRTRMAISARRVVFLGGYAPETVDAETLFLAECLATVPHVVVDAPHGWPKTQEEWEKWMDQSLMTEDRSLYAIYSAYQDGVRLFRGQHTDESPP